MKKGLPEPKMRNVVILQKSLYFCTCAQLDRTKKLYLLRRPRVRIHCRAWSRAPINEEEEGASGRPTAAAADRLEQSPVRV